MALLLALALVASACGSSGDDESSSGSSTTAGTADVDPNGVLRVGMGLQQPAGLHFDPTLTTGTLDGHWMELVLGTLLRVTAKSTYEPMMAKSYELVDPQTVRFTIRDGLKFTDGTVYDAQAVKEGLLRTRDQVTTAAKPSQDTSMQEIGDITVDGPMQLTVKLKSPVGGQFIAAMGTAMGAIVSPAQVKSAPQDINLKAIGAGPYTIVNVEDNRSITLRKNPEYPDAKSWRIKEIHFSDIAEGTSSVNGLLAGSLDLAERLLPTAVEPLKGEGFGISAEYAENSYFYLGMCTGKPPLDNEKVRKAIAIGIDRDELSKLVFADLAEPAYGLWPKDHVNYEPKLAAMLKFDQAKAKKLLAEAGQPAVTLDLYYPSAPLPEYSRILEALQGQLGKIGVTVKIIPGDLLTQFVNPQKPGAMMVPASRTGVGKYVGAFAAGQRLALCGVSHPEIVDMVSPVSAAVPGSASSAALFRKADLAIAEHAYLIPLVFAPRINAYAKTRVGGTLEGDGVNSFPKFDTIYIKKK